MISINGIIMRNILYIKRSGVKRIMNEGLTYKCGKYFRSDGRSLMNEEYPFKISLLLL